MPGILTRRVGPWPVWTWLVILASGIGIAILLRRSSLFGGEPEPVDDAALDDGTYLERPTLPTDGAVQLPVVSAPQTGPSKPTTNLEWEQAAVSWLVASQHVDGTVAAGAIGKYLQGAQLSAQEGAALSLVLRFLGTPPEGAPPPVAPPPSAPPPGGGGAPTSTTPGKVTGLHWSANRTDISWHWAPVAGAGTYRIDLIAGENTILHSTRIGATAKPGWRVQSSYKKPLAPGHPYRIRVWAVNNANKAGAAATQTARTDP